MWPARKPASSASSNEPLDLVLVHDHPEGVEASRGGTRALPPSMYYAKLAQALVAALTSPGAEGRLYDVDMRLRPSGSKGPVAVSLSAFRRYRARESWTWERMALTRARGGRAGAAEARHHGRHPHRVDSAARGRSGHRCAGGCYATCRRTARGTSRRCAGAWWRWSSSRSRAPPETGRPGGRWPGRRAGGSRSLPHTSPPPRTASPRKRHGHGDARGGAVSAGGLPFMCRPCASPASARRLLNACAP